MVTRGSAAFDTAKPPENLSQNPGVPQSTSSKHLDYMSKWPGGFELKFGSWNVGSQTAKLGKLSWILKNRRIKVGFLKKIR